MTTVALLLGYSSLLGLVAPALLVRAGWPIRAPRLAIRLWQAMSLSWLISVVLAGIALMRPWLPPRPLTPRTAGEWIMLLGGAALAGSILVPVGYTIVRGRWHTRRVQRWHASALAFTGRPAPELGATILDQDRPAVYCLSAPPNGRIVITTGALRTLTVDQLDAALAHERAHLLHRHHQLVSTAHALTRALPPIPLLHHAHRQIAVLAEMAADDAARGRHDGRTVAAALVGLAAGPPPASALGAGGDTVRRRLARILVPPEPLPLPARAAAAGSAAGALAMPLALGCTALAALVALVV